MIKHIIKRNGTSENFSAQKLNKWGEWASKTLGDKVAWGDIVLDAVSVLPETVTSLELHTALIDKCIERKTWSYNRMAGRLYASTLYKEAYNENKILTDKAKIPTIKEVHELMLKNDLLSEKFVRSFSDEEYEKINDMIRHSKDLTYPYFQLDQIMEKYSLRNRVTKQIYETAQFVYMRVAMRMAMNKKDRLKHIERFYYFYSNNIINIPTPYFTNAGTNKDNFNSCCVYRTKDTVRSLAAGDHIAYVMTYSSAGIGAFIQTRAENSEIRGGIISHRGKRSYYKALAGAINANMQNGRGGAATVTYECFDPDIKDIQALKHPLTPVSKQVREIDYSMAFNKFFAQKAAKNEEIALFSIDKAPEIYEALTNADPKEFEKIYNKAISENKHSSMVNARDILLNAINQAIETGRHYYCNLDEMNTHTPFHDKIYQSNLCQEIYLPTKAYDRTDELYKSDDSVSGEVAMCSLAALVLPNIKSEEEYSEAAYYCLLMIHTSIHESDYELPHIAYTAKKRNSAGVGLSGVAHYMAKNNLKYDEEDGLIELHKIAERHYWHLVNASLKMSEDYGNAEWINKTKWPEGWLPLDSYNKNVDEIAEFKYQYDWDLLRQKIIDNGGIHNSVVCAQMPAESSSISSGTTNSIYPIRSITLNKSNDDSTIAWVAPNSDTFGSNYQSAYYVKTTDMAKVYGIFQKWTDQGISADEWKVVVGDTKLASSELLHDFFAMVKYGAKSRYYINSKTAKEINLNSEVISDTACVGCTV